MVEIALPHRRLPALLGDHPTYATPYLTVHNERLTVGKGPSLSSTAAMTRDFAGYALRQQRLLKGKEVTGSFSRFLRLRCRNVTVGIPPSTSIMLQPQMIMCGWRERRKGPT